MPSKIDAAGRTLLFLLPRLGPFRSRGGRRARRRGAAPRRRIRRGARRHAAQPAVAAAAAAAAADAASSFGVLTLAGKPAIVNGVAPAMSRDGRSVTWIARTGAATGGGEQRLLLAPTDNLAAPVELHKGTERLDAPAIAADGAASRFR